MTLRPVVFTDWARLFAWRNDPTTYRYFDPPRPVTLQEHLAWVVGLVDGTSPMRAFIAEADGHPVGVVRVHEDGDVSITVDPRRRDAGYARQMLEAVRRELPTQELLARIREENGASLRLFVSAGFSLRAFSEDGWVVLQGKRPAPSDALGE